MVLYLKEWIKKMKIFKTYFPEDEYYGERILRMNLYKNNMHMYIYIIPDEIRTYKNRK